MMSFIPDEATRQRLMKECRNTFPELPDNLVLSVLHDNKYDFARAYSTLVRYHQDITRRASQPALYQSSLSPNPASQSGYQRTYNQYHPQYPVHSLHHSQSDPAIRHHYYPASNSPRAVHYRAQQYGYGPPSSNYQNYPSSSPPNVGYPNYNRSPTPGSYPQSTSPRPQVSTYQSPPRPSYQQPYQPQASNYTPTGRELFVDVSGDVGRHYENIDSAVMHVRPHAPQQCTDPHPTAYSGDEAVSPIDMKVPQLPFPVIQPAPSPNDSPRMGGGAKAKSSNYDEKAYASALLLQQRARMTKLHKHLFERRRGLDELSTEVLEKETRLLTRDNEKKRDSESLAKMAEMNRKLQVQIQLMSQELEHYTSGTAPIGVIDPMSQENFHQSMTELGQAGPMRLPDNTPVHISSDSPYDRGRELDEGDPWDCSTCTFRNHPTLHKCEVCEVPRNTRLPLK